MDANPVSMDTIKSKLRKFISAVQPVIASPYLQLVAREYLEHERRWLEIRSLCRDEDHYLQIQELSKDFSIEFLRDQLISGNV